MSVKRIFAIIGIFVLAGSWLVCVGNRGQYEIR